MQVELHIWVKGCAGTGMATGISKILVSFSEGYWYCSEMNELLVGLLVNITQRLVRYREG